MKVDMYIVILAGIVHASLQLGIGALLLLYHSSLGKHVKKRTRELVTNYILGNGLLSALAITALCFVIALLFDGPMNPSMLTIIALALSFLAISVWGFYYRWGKSTELWLPKSVAKFINDRAKATSSNTEAFSLGMLACFAEAPFTFVLVLIAANSVISLKASMQLIALIIYTVLSILPLIILRLAVRQGQTTVDIQKWRIKNKNFLRILSGIGFFTLAIFILAFKVFHG